MIESLIQNNDKLIKKIANKFYNVEKEDLYQAGCLGLIKANNNYKIEFGDFSHYAYKYIFGEMYDLSIKSRNIKVNKYYLKLYKLIIKTKELLTQQYQKEISLKEVSEYLNIPLNEIENTTMMMDKNIELDDENKLIEISNSYNNDNELIIEESFNNLDPLSSLVMKYRYINDYTQSEVANILGINQVKVSRIESSSKEKIREYLK